MLKQTVKVFCLLSVLSLGALPALAQLRSSSADLTGTVSDPSSLPLRGASVTATNLATGLARAVATDASGVYSIPLLQPGVYELKIEIKGFSAQILIRGQI
jgi:hypothetical protein